MRYSYIPDPATFKRDSSVSLARRASDPVLTRVDNLLAFYQTLRFDTDTEKQLLALAVLTDLFMALRYWLRLAQTTPNHATLKVERQPAMQALLDAVVGRLSQELGVSADGVPGFVRDFKCRDMTDYGHFADNSVGDDLGTSAPARDFYFKTARRAATAVRFKNGVAYRMSTKSGEKGRLVKLNSADFESRMMRGGSASLKGWAPFAMGDEGDLYMTRHFIALDDADNTTHERIFHSTYTGGGPLVAAGTMLVVDGLILGIRGDSGHYRPTDHNIAEALRMLATRGVKIQRIKWHDWEPKNPRPTMGAMAFIASQRPGFYQQLRDKKQQALNRANPPAVQPVHHAPPPVAQVHLAPLQTAEVYQNA